MRTPKFFFALLIPVFFAFSATANARIETGCPTPSNVTVTNQTSSSVSFDWDDCGCGGTYHVRYVRNGQTGPEYVTENSQITVTGLSAGTYQFYFFTVCGAETSNIIVEEVIIM